MFLAFYRHRITSLQFLELRPRPFPATFPVHPIHAHPQHTPTYHVLVHIMRRWSPSGKRMFEKKKQNRNNDLKSKWSLDRRGRAAHRVRFRFPRTISSELSSLRSSHNVPTTGVYSVYYIRYGTIHIPMRSTPWIMLRVISGRTVKRIIFDFVSG